MAEETPKIQIDSDWKKQAQQEKERLAAEVEQKEAQSPASERQRVGPEGVPAASFEEVLATVATQVFMFLGEIANPMTGQGEVNLPLAKHYIDVLSVLEAKTKGNLTDAEKKHLDQLLYESRMRYVQMAGGGVGGVPR